MQKVVRHALHGVRKASLLSSDPFGVGHDGAKVVNETVHVVVVGLHGSQGRETEGAPLGADLGVIVSDTCNIAIIPSWWG